MNDLTLVVRRRVRAERGRVFDAWTRAESVMRWWGPAGVSCPSATIDLRVGGTYRIANALPDGTILWLSGEFEVIEPPERLVYTWCMGEALPERVTVAFETVGDDTEIVIRHERIATIEQRDGHEQGWWGCLDGLDVLVGRPS